MDASSAKVGLQKLAHSGGAGHYSGLGGVVFEPGATKGLYHGVGTVGKHLDNMVLRAHGPGHQVVIEAVDCGWDLLVYFLQGVIEDQLGPLNGQPTAITLQLMAVGVPMKGPMRSLRGAVWMLSPINMIVGSKPSSQAHQAKYSQSMLS